MPVESLPSALPSTEPAHPVGPPRNVTQSSSRVEASVEWQPATQGGGLWPPGSGGRRHRRRPSPAARRDCPGSATTVSRSVTAARLLADDVLHRSTRTTT